jgi:hypothetical protein
MTTLLPWLPGFFFGGVLALYGKYLQASEKKGTPGTQAGGGSSFVK